MKLISGDRIFVILVLSITLAGFAIFSSAALGFLAREHNSVSRDIVIQAALGLGLGMLAFLAARAVSLAQIKRFTPLFYLLSILFTALVFVPGIGLTANGATRWITIGFTTVQPAEFLKIGLRFLRKEYPRRLSR